MTGIAQRPANRPSFEEREAALPVPEVAELLLGMFGWQTFRKYNKQVDILIDQNWLSMTYDEHSWNWNRPTTKVYSSNSPRITPENVGGARQIV